MIYILLPMGTGLQDGRIILLQEQEFSIIFIYTMFLVQCGMMYI